jgi:hypothetical protein
MKPFLLKISYVITQAYNTSYMRVGDRRIEVQSQLGEKKDLPIHKSGVVAYVYNPRYVE